MFLQNPKDVLNRIFAARSTAHIEDILSLLPVVPVEEYHWISNVDRHGAWQRGKLHWVPVGRNRGNGANIKLAGEPFNPIAERTVNGMEALIELKRIVEKQADPSKQPPSNPRDAAERYFGLPRLDMIERMPDADRKRLRAVASDIQKQLQVHLSLDKASSQFAVTIRDFGIGQAPDLVRDTLLSLGQSDKPDKPYLIGLFGQGGSSAYAASEYSVVVSRRAPEIRASEKDNGVGWTIVKHVFPKDRKDNYFAYLAQDETGHVPRFDDSIADAVDFTQGTHFCHINYDFGGTKSAVSFQMYQSLNHVLFNPVLPYELYAMKDKADAMRGTGQRLALRARTSDRSATLDKSFSSLAVSTG